MHAEAIVSYCSEEAHGSRLASKWTIGGSSMLKGICCVRNNKEPGRSQGTALKMMVGCGPDNQGRSEISCD